MEHFTALVINEKGEESKISCLVRRGDEKRNSYGLLEYKYVAKVEYGGKTFTDYKNDIVVTESCSFIVTNKIVEILLIKYLRNPHLRITDIRKTIF